MRRRFSELICTLANLSFAEGCFPAIFKQAIVNPLIKKPGLDKSEPSNFCPISNLNNISKLLERLFLTRFQPHISNSPNFNPLQSAYRKFDSTETSLLNTLDQVYTAADSSQPTVLVSLDLSAAFDTHWPPLYSCLDFRPVSMSQVEQLAGSAHIWQIGCNVLLWDSLSRQTLQYPPEFLQVQYSANSFFQYLHPQLATL